MKDIIGFYQSREQAERVKDELIAAGFGRTDVKIYDRSGYKEETGFWESLKEAFGAADEQDRELYAEAARRGAVAVGLDYDSDDDPQKAVAIMSRGAMDLDQQSAQWRQQGWTGGAASTKTATTSHTATGGTAQAAGGAARQAAASTTGREAIPVVQEELRIGKREVAGGGIRIHTRVTERPVHEQVTLREEHVNVERRPVDRPVTAGDDAFRERSVEVTAKSEQAVVQKNARVVEEVVVNKDVKQRTETVQDTVRRTDVDVQKTGGMPGQTAAFTADTFASELATDQRYRGRDWTTVEPEFRKTYESRYPGGKWEQVKDSIRRGFDNVRSKV